MPPLPLSTLQQYYDGLQGVDKPHTLGSREPIHFADFPQPADVQHPATEPAQAKEYQKFLAMMQEKQAYGNQTPATQQVLEPKPVDLPQMPWDKANAAATLAAHYAAFDQKFNAPLRKSAPQTPDRLRQYDPPWMQGGFNSQADYEKWLLNQHGVTNPGTTGFSLQQDGQASTPPQPNPYVLAPPMKQRGMRPTLEEIYAMMRHQENKRPAQPTNFGETYTTRQQEAKRQASTPPQPTNFGETYTTRQQENKR